VSATVVSTGAGALVSLEEVRAAARRIAGVVVRTPLLPAPDLSAEVGGEVRLKAESLQRAGAFKARGASNFVLQLGDDEVARGVITYSSGNHGQAVALAAGLRGARAVVVMPTTAPQVKQAGAKRLGAEVVLEGTTSLERMVRAEAIAQAEGLVMVPPFDHPWIIAGQGTVGLEIVEEWPEVDTVVVPVGGGGLASGVAAAVRRARPEARVVGVEPEGAASMRAALDAGRPVSLDRVATIADGLAPVRTGELTFQHMRDLADDVVTVSDADIREAARFLLQRQKLVVEFSGAAAVAALRSGRVSAPGRRVAAILSGGNLDPSLMKDLAG
jgi:threonine dehydratase